MADDSRTTTSPALVAVAWLIVGIPFSWGLYNSWLNIRKLFVPPPAVTAPATPGAETPVAAAPVAAVPAK